MKRVLITGSNGLLGQSLLRLLLQEKNQFEVIGLSLGKNRSGRDDFEYRSIDVTSESLLKENVLEIHPDVIINTAAMTQVDACEEHQQECDALNIGVVQSLISVAAQINAHVIHLSTDFIFDGKKGTYKETDAPNPISYYGRSKLKSEEILIDSKIEYTILRTILVYGKVQGMSRNNIVLWVKEQLENKQEITLVEDQFRTPTYVENLALACKISMEKKALGIYHVASDSLLSIYEIGQQIAEVFELDTSLIKPISTSTLNQLAARPIRTGFDLTKTAKELDLHPTSFQQDLQRFKEKLANTYI
jgi:dTDP-4-dehydrorhamnose reductase